MNRELEEAFCFLSLLTRHMRWDNKIKLTLLWIFLNFKTASNAVEYVDNSDML